MATPASSGFNRNQNVHLNAVQRTVAPAKTAYKGVTRDSTRTKPFRAVLTADDGTVTHLGRFRTALAAARAYDTALLQRLGQGAATSGSSTSISGLLNFPAVALQRQQQQQQGRRQGVQAQQHGALQEVQPQQRCSKRRHHDGAGDGEADGSGGEARNAKRRRVAGPPSESRAAAEAAADTGVGGAGGLAVAAEAGLPADAVGPAAHAAGAATGADASSAAALAGHTLVPGAAVTTGVAPAAEEAAAHPQPQGPGHAASLPQFAVGMAPPASQQQQRGRGSKRMRTAAPALQQGSGPGSAEAAVVAAMLSAPAEAVAHTRANDRPLHTPQSQQLQQPHHQQQQDAAVVPALEGQGGGPAAAGPALGAPPMLQSPSLGARTRAATAAAAAAAAAGGAPSAAAAPTAAAAPGLALAAAPPSAAEVSVDGILDTMLELGMAARDVSEVSLKLLGFSAAKIALTARTLAVLRRSGDAAAALDYLRSLPSSS